MREIHLSEPLLSLDHESRKRCLGGAKSHFTCLSLSLGVNMLKPSGSMSHEAFEQVERNSLYEFNCFSNKKIHIGEKCVRLL